MMMTGSGLEPSGEYLSQSSGNTVQAVCFQSVGQVTTETLEPPLPEHPLDAVVRVSMAGLCGSDLHPFWGREQGLHPGTVMGHELVGVVEKVGNSVSKVAVGDRVFVPFSTNCGECYFCKKGLTSRCEVGQLFGWRQQDSTGSIVGLHGCQSELVKVPFADASLKRLPDGVSDEAALLLGDNFSTGFFCAEMANIQPGGTYVVIGCGTVGQLCIVAAKSMGAETLIAVDPVPSRQKQAEQLGAIAVSPDEAWGEVKSRTGGYGVDAVMELVGLPEAQALAFQLVRPGGILSVIGCHCTPNFSFSPVDAYDKNLTYRTGRCPARRYMDVLTDRVASGEFDLSGFVTHQFEFKESQLAYDVFANRKEGCIKAVFTSS
ncbi:MAG: alcohol dehydrogenase catalytic domain-containing protein [Planctomycetota bacterium]